MPTAPSLVICGSGHTVWDDLEALKALKGDAWLPNKVTGGLSDIMCVNDVGMFIPYHVEHWFTNHVKSFGPWNDVREFRYNRIPRLHSSSRVNDGGNLPVEKWDVSASGSSGLCACWVGDLLGYSEIILCGVPLDNGPHFFDKKPTNFEYLANDTLVERLAREVGPKLSSMSGRTRDAFGHPGDRG